MQRNRSRMPVVFFGHGSPMNTLERNQYTESWRKLGNSIPKPKADLCVAAHWYTEGTAVTAMDKPKTIHDFYGFPQALFDVQYAAPGDPQLASRVRELLDPVEVRLDESWGLRGQQSDAAKAGKKLGGGNWGRRLCSCEKKKDSGLLTRI